MIHMNKLKEAFSSVLMLGTSVVVGAISGSFYLLGRGMDCLKVDVPDIEPTVKVDLDFSEVDFSKVINAPKASEINFLNLDALFATLFNQEALKDSLANISVNTQIDIPHVTPTFDVNDCAQSLFLSTGVVVGAASIGLLGYYAVSCQRETNRRAQSSREESESIHLERLI